MGYTIHLFRKEVKEQNSGFDFLENDKLVLKFTAEQFEKLKTRLLSYGYQIEREEDHYINFNYKGGELGITASLTKAQLSFSSGFSQNGIFEIGMTASEFTDSEEFTKLDLQAGGWEEI